MRTFSATEPAPGHANEDMFLANHKAVVVLDGATIPRNATRSCHHTTRWFAQTLGQRVFEDLNTHQERDLRDTLADSITWFRDLHASTCEIHDLAHPSATILILRETQRGCDYLVLGDSTLVLDGPTGIKAVSDRRLQDNIAPSLRARLQHLGRDSAEHGAARAELLAAERAGRNTDGGYWIAATDPQAAHHALTGHLAPNEIHSALLLTDGASVLVDRFATIDWKDLLVITRTEGPVGVIERVRAAEDDPAIATLPRSKLHDDATIVYCEIDAPDR